MRILRYILWFLIILLVLAVLGNLIFGGKKSSDSTNSTQDNSPQTSYADSAGSTSAVTFVTAGIINGTELHRSIRISVSNTTRVLEILEGYSGKILSTQTYANNQEAYREFLSAIYKAGYTTENTANTNPNIAGRCPLGTRFVYTSSEIPNSPDELWTTSCSTVIGTFGGDANTINQLFRLQIPNYSKQTSGVNLNASS